MTVRSATFDFSGAIVSSTDGYNSTSGTAPTLDTTGKMRGPNSAKHLWAASANSSGGITITAATEMYCQFYFMAVTVPTATCRVGQMQNSATQWDIRYGTAPTLAFRWLGNTLYTTPTLTLNKVYRFGVHYKCESVLGAADGIMEVWMADGDDAYGAPKASNTATGNVSDVSGITTCNFGHSNAASVSGEVWFDDIRITNELYMPGVSIAPPPPFPLVSTVYHM